MTEMVQGAAKTLREGPGWTNAHHAGNQMSDAKNLYWKENVGHIDRGSILHHDQLRHLRSPDIQDLAEHERDKNGWNDPGLVHGAPWKDEEDWARGIPDEDDPIWEEAERKGVSVADLQGLTG